MKLFVLGFLSVAIMIFIGEAMFCLCCYQVAMSVVYYGLNVWCNIPTLQRAIVCNIRLVMLADILSQQWASHSRAPVPVFKQLQLSIFPCFDMTSCVDKSFVISRAFVGCLDVDNLSTAWTNCHVYTLQQLVQIWLIWKLYLCFSGLL